MVTELSHLLQDPAHWAFEGITDIVFTGALLLAGRIPFRRWLRRHDEQHHGEEHCEA